MIFKTYYLGVFFVILLLLQSCSIKRTTSIPIKDTEGHPIIEKIDGVNIYYNKEDGTKLIAHLGGIEFNGGKQALKAYIDSVYYNNPYYNYTEYNVLEYFHILFTKDLTIEEVRMLYRKPDNTFYYQDILIDALKKTTGKWHKITNEDKEWYTYLYGQRIF